MDNETTEPSEPVVVDPPAPEPTPIQEALVRYDLAVDPVVARLRGGIIFTHEQAQLLAQAIRAGLAAALGYLDSPEPLPEPAPAHDAYGDARRAQREANVGHAEPQFGNVSTPLVEPAPNLETPPPPSTYEDLADRNSTPLPYSNSTLRPYNPRAVDPGTESAG